MSGVNIKVTADAGSARRELKRLESSMDSLANTAKNINKTILGIGAAISLAFGTDKITKASDAFTTLENKIALVTGRTKELSKTLDELYSVSIRSRGSIQGSVETFNRFGRAMDQSAISTQRLLNVTESVQKAIAVSGGNAASAEAAILQLGQGLAAGQLRGQELNSVMEQTPRIARAIADELGVGIGALRAMAEQGQLTTELVFGAMENQASKIAKEFQLANATIAQGFRLVVDQITRVIGMFDMSTYALKSLGVMFEGVADYMNKNARSIAIGAAYYFNILEHSISGIIEVAKGLGAVLGSVFGRLIDALPRVIIPMRTLSDDIFLGLLYGSAKVTTNIFKLVGAIDSLIGTTLGTRFEGVIFKLFTSKSLIEFGNNLDALADAISTYGRRWFNVGNFAETAFRQTNFTLLKTGIYLGLIDQKLFALRFTSFERLYKVVEPLQKLFQSLLIGFLSLDAIAPIVAVIVGSFQLLSQVINSVLNLFGLELKGAFRALLFVEDLLQNIFEKLGSNIAKRFGLRTFEPIRSALENVTDSWTLALGLFDIRSRGPLESILNKFSKFGISAGKAIVFGVKAIFNSAVNKIVENSDRINRAIINSLIVIKNFSVEVSKAIKGGVSSFLSFWKDLFDGAGSIASSQLAKTLNVVKNFAKKVVDWFFWIYDEVIANSWWTDLMEGVYEKTIQWLPKALSKVQDFISKVGKIFASLKSKSFKLPEFKAKGAEMLSGLTKGFSKFLTGVFKSLRESFPDFTKAFTTVVSASILALASPALFKKVGFIFGLGFAATIGAAILDTLGGALSNSRISSDLGASLGAGAGKFVNTLISNIPLLLELFLKFAKAFGKAFLDEIKGVFGAIPSLLSSATFGVFDTLIGTLLSIFGGSILLRGFSKTTKSMNSMLGAVGLAGSKGGGSIISDMLYGKGGVNAGRGKILAGVAGLMIGVNGLLGGFTSGGSIVTSALSGGLLAYSLFGVEGVQTILSKVKSLFSGIGGVIKTESASFAKNQNLTTGLASIAGQVKGGNLKGALSEAQSTISKFKTSVASGKFDTPFLKSVDRMAGKITSSFGPQFASSLGPQFTGLGNSLGNNVQKGFSKSKFALIAAGIAAITVGFASQASAASASTEANLDRTLETLKDNAAGIATGGIMALALFGAEGIKSFSKNSVKAVADVARSLVGITTLMNAQKGGLILNFLFGKMGTISIISKAKFAGKLVGKVLTSSLLKSMLGIGARIAAALLSFVSIPGVLAAGAIGFIGIMLFGEGDGIIEKLDLFASKIRNIFTDSTRESRKLRREIKGISSELPEAVGEIELDIQTSLDKIDFTRVSDQGFKNLERSLGSLIRVSESSNSSFDELGRLSALEEAKTRAAIRDVELAVARLPQGGSGEVDGSNLSKDILTMSGLISLAEQGMFTASVINLRDNPELFALQNKVFSKPVGPDRSQKITINDQAPSEDIAEYLIGVTAFLRRSEELSAKQTQMLNVLETFGDPLIALANGTISGIDPALSNLFLKLSEELSLIGPEPVDSNAFVKIFKGITGQEEEPRSLIANTVIDSLLKDMASLVQVTQVSIDSAKKAERAVQDGLTVSDMLESTQAITGGEVEFDSEAFLQLGESVRGGLVSAAKEAGAILNEIKFKAFVDAVSSSDIANNSPIKLAVKDQGISLSDLINTDPDKLSNTVLDGLRLAFNAIEFSPDDYPDIFSELYGQELVELNNFTNSVEETFSLFSSRLERQGMSLREQLDSLNLSEIIPEGSIKAIDLNIINQEDIDILAAQVATYNSHLDTLSGKALEVNLAETATSIAELVNGVITSNSALLASSELVTGNPITEAELYAIEPSLLVKIGNATKALLGLAAAKAILFSGGLSVSEIPKLNELVESMVTPQATLDDNLTKPDTDKKGGGKQETLFEKFVGGLNSSGFKFDIESASKLGSAAINSLKSPLESIKALQASIVDLGVSDVAGRQKALANLKEQKKTISDILMLGTMDQKAVAFEALGADSSVLKFNDLNAEEIALNLASLQSDLNNTLSSDLESRKAITSEIRSQQTLLEGITAGAEASTAAITDTLKESISGVLKGTMSLKESVHNLLDGISTEIIDTVVNSFTQAFMESAGLKEMFDGLFKTLFSGGATVGEKLGDSISGSISGAMESATGNDASFWGSLSSGFGDIISSLGESLSGVFSSVGSFFSGSGGGGGILTSILGLFGGGGAVAAATGGYIKGAGTGTSDSIPAMLSNGEFVMKASSVSKFGSSFMAAINNGKIPSGFAEGGLIGGNNSMLTPTQLVSAKSALSGEDNSNSKAQQQVYNINVTGDVSRQTRKEIVKMIPQITGGVNATNRERGGR